MTTKLLEDIKILYTVTNPCWDWYTNQVKTVKTPADGFKYRIRMAAKWAGDNHLQETIQHSLYKHSSLAFMGMPVTYPFTTEHQELARKTLKLTWSVMQRRVWSLSRHGIPPESCAPLASSDKEVAKQTMAKMKADWAAWMALEARRYELPEAAKLHKAIDFATSTPIRLLFAAFERDNWDVESKEGRRLLNGLLFTLPDNKIVEDTHNSVRLVLFCWEKLTYMLLFGPG